MATCIHSSRSCLPFYTISIFPLLNRKIFHLLVNSVPTQFLLDTGSAVTLLRRDTWARITANCPQELEPHSFLKLVGVDGSPLTIHGRAKVYLQLGGKIITLSIVVSSLTNEAILGLDFLQDQLALIDLAKNKVHLSNNIGVPLIGNKLSSTSQVSSF